MIQASLGASSSDSFSSDSSSWPSHGHGNILLRMNEIQNNPGSTHAIKRVGRGIGSGRGKTSTRGMNGQRKRAGFNLPVGFEGGQTPIQKKMPKLAEKNNAKKNTNNGTSGIRKNHLGKQVSANVQCGMAKCRPS